VSELSEFSASHPAIKLYLDYVENTESPRLFHVWSFLSSISAAMGRRCWLPMGTGEVWPNQYIILTGPPAVRKSTAFKISCSFLRKYTGVKFAPDDTGGQRQGMISAMMDCGDKDSEDDNKIIQALAQGIKASGEADTTTSLADLSHTLDVVGDLHLDTRDPRTMFIAASELNSVLGEGNTALLTFLQKMWDGDAYKYQLKSTSVELKDALLGIIGATTPSQLALAMPPEAVGQGFTSRVIFVYADKKHARRIARPTLRTDLEPELGGIFSKVFHEFHGPFEENKLAAREMDKLYERGVAIQDPRFVHYADRRHTHLQKVCMALAASRGSNTIELIDVKFADQLLMFTEQSMSEALGEYGMNKLGAAKQRLLDYLKTTDAPIPTNLLYGMLSRDMSQIDFKKTIMELHNAGKLTQVVIPTLGSCIIAVSEGKARSAKKDLNSIQELIAR
jgi:hypothetical protein